LREVELIVADDRAGLVAGPPSVARRERAGGIVETAVVREQITPRVHEDGGATE